MSKKKLLIITAVILVIALTVSAVLVAFLKPQGRQDNSTNSAEHDELFVRELLDGCDISVIVDDPNWEAAVVDSTANYVMVDADKFDFSQKIGIEDGYTNIYFDSDTNQINMLQHNYVTYTNELNPKEELQNLIGNVQSNITAILGNPSEAFMLINTQGESGDYDNLSLEEMMNKVLEGNYVMYVMYESNGLRYEMNIMFSDDTLYSMVWIYDDSPMHGEQGGQ